MAFNINMALKVAGIAGIAAGAYWLGKRNFGFSGLGYGGRETMLPPEPAPWEWEDRYMAKRRVMEQELNPAARKRDRAERKKRERQAALDRKMARERKAMVPEDPGVGGFGAMFSDVQIYANPGLGSISHDELRRIKQRIDEAQRALDIAIRRR